MLIILITYETSFTISHNLQILLQPISRRCTTRRTLAFISNCSCRTTTSYSPASFFLPAAASASSSRFFCHTAVATKMCKSINWCLILSTPAHWQNLTADCLSYIRWTMPRSHGWLMRVNDAYDRRRRSLVTAMASRHIDKQCIKIHYIMNTWYT